MKITKETITISLTEYKSLKADQAFLEILEGYGVDNWVGYDDAVEYFQGEYNSEN